MVRAWSPVALDELNSSIILYKVAQQALPVTFTFKQYRYCMYQLYQPGTVYYRYYNLLRTIARLCLSLYIFYSTHADLIMVSEACF